MQAELCGILGHVGVRRYLDEVHLGDRNFSCGSDCAVRAEASPELLMVEDGRPQVDALHEVFLDEENRRPWLLVPF